MNIWESVRLAVKALVANKMRAALTMLGIIIGVGAVITLMSVGQGVQEYITAQFQSIGSNLFFVMPGSTTVELKKPAYLTTKDVEALRDPVLAPDVLYVAPEASTGKLVSIPGEDKEEQIRGVTAEYSLVRGWKPAVGRFITHEDNQTLARVAVLGKETANYFFPDNPDPSGEIVRINGIPFRVIGVMEEKGGLEGISAEFPSGNRKVVL